MMFVSLSNFLTVLRCLRPKNEFIAGIPSDKGIQQICFLYFIHTSVCVIFNSVSNLNVFHKNIEFTQVAVFFYRCDAVREHGIV